MTNITPPLPPLTNPPDKKRIIGAAIAALLSVLMVLFLDPKFEFHMLEEPLLWAGDNLKLDDFFYATEALGEYPPLIVIFWGIIAIAPRRRAYLGGLLVALIISGATVLVIKEAAGRARPDYSVIVNEGRQQAKKRDMMELANKYPHLEIQRDELGGVTNQGIWLLWNRPLELVGKNQFTSFPSGHANQGLILAVFMTAFCKGRGKVLWYLLGVTCALSRVRYERHFPSDVLLGGTFGYLITHWVLSWQWPVTLGAKLFRAQLDDGGPLETGGSVIKPT